MHGLSCLVLRMWALSDVLGSTREKIAGIFSTGLLLWATGRLSTAFLCNLLDQSRVVVVGSGSGSAAAAAAAWASTWVVFVPCGWPPLELAVVARAIITTLISVSIVVYAHIIF